MRRILALFTKSLAVALLMLMATTTNARIASPTGVLRVFWNKFEVTASDNNTVVLTWNVTEYNNKSFQIQHSENGTDWKEIAVIPSKNSLESMVDYSYRHINKSSGKQFYRVQELDVDVNSAGYSPVRTLILQNETPEIGIGPNPATSHVAIVNNDNENMYTKARIYDLGGKVVAEKSLDSHTGRIAISELLPGTYIVQIENNKGARISQKIIKQ